MLKRWFTLLLGCAACTPVAPAAPSSPPATVWYFVATDCPISNAYAPEMARIAADYETRGVRFRCVYSDPDTTAGAAAAHARAYGLRGTVVSDPDGRQAARLGATITPEVAVETAGGRVVYLGRINDRWAAWQRRRAVVRHHDLRDALDAVLAGRAVAQPRTPAVGCDIPDAAPSGDR